MEEKKIHAGDRVLIKTDSGTLVPGTLVRLRIKGKDIIGASESAVEGGLCLATVVLDRPRYFLNKDEEKFGSGKKTLLNLQGFKDLFFPRLCTEIKKELGCEDIEEYPPGINVKVLKHLTKELNPDFTYIPLIIKPGNRLLIQDPISLKKFIVGLEDVRFNIPKRKISWYTFSCKVRLPESSYEYYHIKNYILDPDTFKNSIFPKKDTLEISFKVGDMVTIQGSEQVKALRDNKPSYIPSETVYQIKEINENIQAVLLEIIGKCDYELLGLSIQVPIRKVVPYCQIPSIMKKDQEIEICADIKFRKTSLLGKRGKVIIPTDLEGDVGVEFMEDLQAGSLDGVGNQGKCLYIKERALRITE